MSASYVPYPWATPLAPSTVFFIKQSSCLLTVWPVSVHQVRVCESGWTFFSVWRLRYRFYFTFPFRLFVLFVFSLLRIINLRHSPSLLSLSHNPGVKLRHWGTSGLEVRVGTWRQKPKDRLEEHVTGFLSYLSYTIQDPKPTAQGWHHSGLGPPHQSFSASQICPQASWGHFLNRCSPFPDDLSLFQVDKNPPSTETFLLKFLSDECQEHIGTMKKGGLPSSVTLTRKAHVNPRLRLTIY